MDIQKLKRNWLEEEKKANMIGWNFSHIYGRYIEEHDLPWDYETYIRTYRKDTMELLDMDTGGGEFLLGLHHPYEKTSATEGFLPNVKLCEGTLKPLGIHFERSREDGILPFEASSFDLIINRHSDFKKEEVYRVLKPGGIFITQQIGEDNDKDLIFSLLGEGYFKPTGGNAKDQAQEFKEVGFQV